MEKLPRTLWEILAFVVLAAIGYGLWSWSNARWGRQLAETEGQLRSEIAAEREKAADVLRQRGAEEAEVAARAFAAGIQEPALEGRQPAVDAAVGELLHLPGVVFVHVLGRDGTVIATSDRKLVATGRPGPRSAWALSAAAVTRRAGTTSDITEVAVPIGDADGAVVWMAYEVGRADTVMFPPEIPDEAGPGNAEESEI